MLAGRRLVVLDTETTGMSPDAGDRLVEVAYVAIEDGRIGASGSSLVQPGRDIPIGATRVHGIDAGMVKDAPGYPTVGKMLREAIGDAPAVFHNYPFDLPFLIVLFREAGVPRLDTPVIDTLGLARMMPRVGSNSLGPLAQRLGIEPGTAHRALGDARTTAEVFLALAAMWAKDRPETTLAQLAGDSQDAMRVSEHR
jgi:DNA polymerase-3 subunit epsilon